MPTGSGEISILNSRCFSQCAVDPGLPSAALGAKMIDNFSIQAKGNLPLRIVRFGPPPSPRFGANRGRDRLCRFHLRFRLRGCFRFRRWGGRRRCLFLARLCGRIGGRKRGTLWNGGFAILCNLFVEHERVGSMHDSALSFPPRIAGSVCRVILLSLQLNLLSVALINPVQHAQHGRPNPNT